MQIVIWCKWLKHWLAFTLNWMIVLRAAAAWYLTGWSFVRLLHYVNELVAPSILLNQMVVIEKWKQMLVNWNDLIFRFQKKKENYNEANTRIHIENATTNLFRIITKWTENKQNFMQFNWKHKLLTIKETHFDGQLFFIRNFRISKNLFSHFKLDFIHSIGSWTWILVFIIKLWKKNTKQIWKNYAHCMHLDSKHSEWTK